MTSQDDATVVILKTNLARTTAVLYESTNEHAWVQASVVCDLTEMQ